MKTKILFIALFSLLFFSCEYTADDTNTFPAVDYSNLITEDGYKIDSSVDALTVFNLFYNVYGYGEFEISGSAEHSESSKLIETTYTEKLSCNITKIKVYHLDNSSSGMHISSFFVDFINDKNEILSYCYEWQYKNTNIWKNDKTSTWYMNSDWYKNSSQKTRTDWKISIVL